MLADEDKKRKKWMVISKVNWIIFILMSLILLFRTGQILAFYYMYFDNLKELNAPTYQEYMIYIVGVQVISLVLGLYANKMKKHTQL